MGDPTEPNYAEIDPALLARYLMSRDEDQQMLGRLEEATESLTSEVAGLRDTLTTYATKGDITALDATHEERLRAEAESRLQGLVALRLRIRRQTWILFTAAALLFVAACVVGGLALHSNNKALTEYKNDRYSACLLRNSEAETGIAETRSLLGPQLIREEAEKHPDPVVVTVLKGLVNAKPQTVPCTG